MHVLQNDKLEGMWKKADMTFVFW